MQKFEYIQPSSIKSASKYLRKNNNSALPFAGGTDILGLMKDNIFSPKQLVNLKKIDDLNYIKYDVKEGLRIGALTKLSDIVKSDLIKNKYSALHQAASEVATLQLRNIATIGGNICQRPRCFYFRGEFDCIRKGGDTCFAVTGNNKYHCIVGGGSCYIVHPSDTAVTLLAFDAKFIISNSKEKKEIAAKDFFVLPDTDDMKENILDDGEILTEIILPNISSSTLSSYIKVKERETWDFALVSIAGVFNRNRNIIKDGKITFGGVAPAPWEEHEVNKQLVNFKVTEENISELSNLAFHNHDALEMNGYKVILARNLIKKLLLSLS